MRLLYLCSDFGIDPRGAKGASIHLRAITRALAERSHEVWLLSPKGAPADGAPVRALLPGGCPPVEQAARMLKQWLSEHELSDSAAREFRPLIYNAWVREPAQQMLRTNPPEAIVERLSLFGHVGVDLANAFDVPLILEVNAPLTEEATRYRSLEMGGLAASIERRVYQRADAVMAVSEALADHLVADGVDREKIHVVPNGADIDVFAAAPSRDECRAKLGLGDEFTIGFVGSLKAWHGVDVLLAAFEMMRRRGTDARLVIVGTGPCETALREQAARFGLNGAVSFTGAVAHEEIPALLGAMDVAAAPFRDAPGFYFSPIKLFEYMAAGTCVVASRLGQIAEVIEDGVTGLLCDPGDPKALAAALERARRSVELRSSLGEAASDAARSRHTWARAAEEVSRIVEHAVQRRSRHAEPAAASG